MPADPPAGPRLTVPPGLDPVGLRVWVTWGPPGPMRWTTCHMVIGPSPRGAGRWRLHPEEDVATDRLQLDVGDPRTRDALARLLGEVYDGPGAVGAYTWSGVAYDRHVGPIWLLLCGTRCVRRFCAVAPPLGASRVATSYTTVPALACSPSDVHALAIVLAAECDAVAVP